MRLRRKHLLRTPDLLSVKYNNYARWFKVSGKLLRMGNINLLLPLVNHEVKKIHNVKGRFISNLKMQIGVNGIDFRDDIKTVCIDYKIFKKPRFIKGYFSSTPIDIDKEIAKFDS